MSRSKNAINGFLADFFGQILGQTLAFISIPFILNNLPTVSYGYWLTIGSIMTWISISDLGIGIALSRILIRIKALIEDEINYNKEKTKLISTSLIIFLICAFVFFASSALIYPFTLKWFKIDFENLTEYKYCYFIASLAGALSLPLSIFSGILESQQKLVLNRNINSLINIVNTILSVFLIMFFKNIISLSIALLSSVLIRALISIYYTNNQKKYFNLCCYNKQYARELFSFGGYFQLAKIANIVALNTDMIFITLYLGAGIVPSYNFTSKLSQIFSVVIVSKVPSAIFAGMSQIIDENNETRIKQIFNSLTALLARIGIFSAILIFFFNENFVNLWVGKNYFLGYSFNLLLVYVVLFETMIRGTSSLILSYGNIRNWSIVSLFEAIINIILSIILINQFGITGVLLATIISRSLTTGIYTFHFFYSKKLITIELFRITKHLFVRMIPNYIFCFIVHYYNPNLNWLELIIIIFISLVINIFFIDWKKIILNKKKGLKIIFSSIILQNDDK